MKSPRPARRAPAPDPDLLPALLEATAAETGLPFFKALVQGLSEALGTHGAWITEYLPDRCRLNALALRLGGQWIPHYEYALPGTPCGAAIDRRDILVVQNNVTDLFPGDNDLKEFGARSYIGTGIFDESGQTLLGHLAVLHTSPLPDPERYARVFRVFASRAGAEMRRWRLERELRARTEELDAVIDNAMDAILILDEEHTIVRINAAAVRTFGSEQLAGELVDRCLSVDGAGKLAPLLEDLLRPGDRTSPRLWIPGGIEARSALGEKFAVEGTLSRFELHGRPFATLILRNINDRLEAEARLHTLTEHSAYLREEIEAHFGDIIGQSPCIRRLVSEIAEVAATDVSVLITGETGTGKELVARAVHRASPRCEAPLIKVNCAAIPETLIESEFFGHEKGAFTGALTRREGRFSLAHGGTLFLDEIGELPLPLQAKLLRVLQEGEFEPVGSSRTVKVDVRVIAATNRDLRNEAAAGRFREDLYYRLAVFPLHVPALRQRGRDIELLAREFARRFCSRHGKPAAEPSVHDLERLRAYPWPGNVRELANVIERALITGDWTRLNLDRALPADTASEPPANAATETPPDRILTAREFEDLERANFRRALRTAKGKISGPGGAAALLGLKPTTLRSRLQVLGIHPRDEIPSPV
ncbi:MAG: AAA family ATPase [Puniceicoccaceae bacterium]|nr:MAG: AAA family ATPase [Puniceicoccaceae bacterium]